MKVLCVAEKPSIAKSITEILAGGRWDTRESGHKYVRNYDFSYRLPAPLGNQGYSDFTVTAVLGHLTSTDFGDDHRQWSSCDPFALFDAQILTFIGSSLKPIERNLQREARQADLLMIWTDCDREGEHIGSEIVEVCRKVNRGIIVKRARFSAIIPAQIHQACRQAGDLDMMQADAVSARMALDLRIGAAFTRLTTMTLQTRIAELQSSVISYGPCQFPTLGFVVDQYNRVQAFVPEAFWYIYVAIERPSEDPHSRDVETVEFKWRRNHLFDMETVVALYEQCVDEPMATVTSVETKPTTKWKPFPLTTVELQQSGSRLLHMTPKKILDIAEKLYQKGILSYPRTETDQYDKDFDFHALIQKQTYNNDWGQYSQRLLDGEFQRPRNGRKNDKAHPPIHPTSNSNDLAGDEKRVFELVTRRFLASCSTNAEGKTTTVEIDIAGEFFSTSGLVVMQRNYLEVYPYDKWASSAVPDFQENEQFMPSVLEVKEGKTSRPNLLTEADLVGLMDKNGIGTDATIAEHIAKIIEREYVTEKQEQRVKYLVPSSLGVGLVEGYNAIGFDRSLSKPHLRAETEHRMQRICDGLQTKRDVLDFTIDQYKEVYIKARRQFDTVVTSVMDYLHGHGEAQEALRAAARGRGRGAARGARGARGGRGGAAGGRPAPRNDDDDDDDDSGNDQGPPRGGGRGGRARGSTRGTTTGRGRGRGGAESGTSRKRPNQIDDAEGRTCGCGSDAVLRTAGQASRNAGRSFYTCPKPQGQQCGFFEWADEESAGTNAGARPGPSRARAAPVSRDVDPDPPAPKRSRMAPPRGPDEDGETRCECGLEAKSAVASKEGPNKGRRFWTCPNSKRAQCGFFQWDDNDDGGGEGGYIAGPSRGGGGGGGGQTSGECFKCGREGHWSNACPDGDRGGGGSRVKPKGRTKSSAGGGGGGGGECFKCGQSGHWANACPDPDGGPARGQSRTASRGGGGGGGGAGGGGECFKCNQPGHWANACPNEDGGGSNRRRR